MISLRKNAWAMVTPPVILLFSFGLFPLIYFIYTVTHRWSLISGLPPKFIGTKNFTKLFFDERFYDALSLSITFTVVTVSLQLILGIFFAELLFKSKFHSLRSLVLLPMMVAPTAAGLLWRFMFNDEIGVINYLLSTIGIDGPLWLGDPVSALAAIMLVDTWQWTPFVVLVVYSGLSNVPQNVLESATIDGANARQKFFLITIPLIKNAIFVALIFRTIDSLRVFDTIYIITSGGPNNATELLNFYVYLTSFRFFDIGYGSTLAFGTLILVIVTSELLQLWLRKATTQ